MSPSSSSQYHDDHYFMDSSVAADTEADTAGETIALLGGNGPTTKHFVKKALDAGYVLRLLPSNNNNNDNNNNNNNGDTFAQNENLTIITPHSSWHDPNLLEEVLQGAVYVVCLLGDNATTTSNVPYQPDTLYQLIKTIYPLMKESFTRVFLYQATAFTVDAHGEAPIMAKLVKKSRVWFRRTTNQLRQKDHDKTVCYIGENTEDWFRYIVVRPPSWIRDGPSRKVLAASKSQPGPMPVMAVDLAEFTLNALRNEKLYNKCPYVVANGF